MRILDTFLESTIPIYKSTQRPGEVYPLSIAFKNLLQNGSDFFQPGTLCILHNANEIVLLPRTTIYVTNDAIDNLYFLIQTPNNRGMTRQDLAVKITKLFIIREIFYNVNDRIQSNNDVQEHEYIEYVAHLRVHNIERTNEIRNGCPVYSIKISSPVDS